MNPPPSLLGAPREWAIDLAAATAVGVFLGVIGPFGSFNGGAIELRVAYWVANMWLGYAILSTTARLSVMVGLRLDLPIWFALAAGVAVGAWPVAILTGWFGAWFWPGFHGRMAPLLVQYGEVLALAEPFSFAYYFLSDRTSRRGDVPSSARPEPAGPDARPSAHGTDARQGPSFLDRLPPRLGRELFCLRMEDHYVRAYTARGSDLILTPLKDAIAELDETDGLQVHRSWWVARAAVVGHVAAGRNLILRLTNGLEVPVSRASVARLRAAGWLEES